MVLLYKSKDEQWLMIKTTTVSYILIVIPINETQTYT